MGALGSTCAGLGAYASPDAYAGLGAYACPDAYAGLGAYACPAAYAGLGAYACPDACSPGRLHDREPLPMIAVLSLLLVVTFFIVSARVATVALMGTGMATDAAAFQARSALMGVGYTTSEAEDVINHPVRRRIILWLMTIGNAGIITGIASLLLGFVNAGSGQVAARRVLMLAIGLILLLLLTRSALLERALNRLTKVALSRWTQLETRDLASLLRFGHNYGVIELATKEDDWLVGRPLAELHLPDEGIVILGVHRRNGPFTGTPTGKTVVQAGDMVIAYGRLDHLRDLDERHKGRTGDLAHEQAVEETMGELRSLLDDE